MMKKYVILLVSLFLYGGLQVVKNQIQMKKKHNH